MGKNKRVKTYGFLLQRQMTRIVTSMSRMTADFHFEEGKEAVLTGVTEHCQDIWNVEKTLAKGFVNHAEIGQRQKAF